MTVGMCHSVTVLLDGVNGILGELGIDGNITVGDSLLRSTLAGALVGRKVKGDEENKVAGKNTASGKGGKFLASTLAVAGHPWEISGGEVSVRGEVYEAKIDDKLSDLKTSDPLLPPDLDTAGRLEVVPVHDNVDSEVKSDGNPRNSGVSNQLGIAEEGSCTMVIAVEESQRLLLEEQENGVKEFNIFGEIVQIVQNKKRLSPSTSVVTDAVEQAILPESRNQLLQEQDKQPSREQGKEQVVNLKQKTQLDRIKVLHDFAPTKDDRIIGSNDGQ